MSKNSSKRLYKQLQNWFSNEIHHGRGHKRVKNKYGNYIKIKNERFKQRTESTLKNF